jgi:hypothetical protein
MKKYDRVLVTLLVVGIWALVFTFVFSPNLTKARDPFPDDEFERDFWRDRDTGSIGDGYTIIGKVTIQTPYGPRDTGRLNCQIREKLLRR